VRQVGEHRVQRAGCAEGKGRSERFFFVEYDSRLIQDHMQRRSLTELFFVLREKW